MTFKRNVDCANPMKRMIKDVPWRSMPREGGGAVGALGGGGGSIGGAGASVGRGEVTEATAIAKLEPPTAERIERTAERLEGERPHLNLRPADAEGAQVHLGLEGLPGITF